MTILDFLAEYKGLIGGFSIAVATVIAVLISIKNSIRAEHRLNRRKSASYASAISSELIHAFHNLIALYSEIESLKGKKNEVINHRYFYILAYEKLLDAIGDLGSSLAYLTADVYGEIKKIQDQLEILEIETVIENKEEILLRIQTALSKTLACSTTLLLYSDYLNGNKFLSEMRPRRLLWIERLLDEFCKYVAKIDNDMEFVAAEENLNMAFLKRFRHTEDVTVIKSLFINIHNALDKMPHYKPWQVQLILRALSYKFLNSLSHFLDIEPNEYDILAEREYDEYLAT